LCTLKPRIAWAITQNKTKQKTRDFPIWRLRRCAEWAMYLIGHWLACVVRYRACTLSGRRHPRQWMTSTVRRAATSSAFATLPRPGRGPCASLPRSRRRWSAACRRAACSGCVWWSTRRAGHVDTNCHARSPFNCPPRPSPLRAGSPRVCAICRLAKQPFSVGRRLASLFVFYLVFLWTALVNYQQRITVVVRLWDLKKNEIRTKNCRLSFASIIMGATWDTLLQHEQESSEFIGVRLDSYSELL